MAGVLRWGVVVAGLALAASGVQAGDMGPEPDPPEPRRHGPARLVPAALGEIPRLGDAEKDRRADLKRDEAIEGLRRFLARLEDGSPRKADLLFRLAELFSEKSQYLYRLEMERYLEAERAHDAAVARGEKSEPPRQDHTDSERYRAETLRLYDTLLAGYPKFPQRDEILFALGYNLQELGRAREAVARYQELIQHHPASPFVPDAYIQLGNYYFENNKLARAREHYQKARDSGVPKVYVYAVYKLAWCDYNAGTYEEGLSKLQEVVEIATQRGAELSDLKTEALNDLTRFYVQLDQPREALAYFKARAPARRVSRLLARTAEGLADAGRFDSAILLWRTLIAEEPLGATAPEYQQSIVRAYEGLRQRQNVREEMRRMVELYRPDSPWWQANADRKEVLRNAFNVTEEALRTLVTEYHQEAQKTQQVETYRLARDIYKQYVDTFASNPNPEWVSDSAFNMRFFHAEVLWALEEWEAAAEAYDAVVAFPIPERDSAREVSNPAWRKNAAYAAVLVHDKLVKLERGQITRNPLRDGQKVDDSRDKGQMEKRGRIHLPGKGERREEPLTPHERKLVAACDTYNRLYPGSEDELDLRYQAAVLFYDRHQDVEASRRFTEIISRFPSERRSRDAADLVMFLLESRQQWQELNQVARGFAANRKLTRGDAAFAARVARVVEGSQYKWIHEVLYLQEKNAARAGEEFLKLVSEFPHSVYADRALMSAQVVLEEARELDKAVQAGERFLKEYPDSLFEPKVRYGLARLYERLAEHRKAAAMYEAFVSSRDAAVRASRGLKPGKSARPEVKGPEKQDMALDASRDEARAQAEEERRALLTESAAWVPEALYQAGLWWDGLGETDKAVSAWMRFLRRFGDKPEAPQVALDLGRVLERSKRWWEAARAYKDFNATYARHPQASALQHYVARDRQLYAWIQLGNTRQVERLQGELLREQARLSTQERQQMAALDAYAHARFLELEPQWRRYVEIRFNRVATLRRDLVAKQRELQRLERACKDVVTIGSGEWGIAALTRLGLAYADFARNILESPDPPGLDEEQRALYRDELQRLALPLEDKSADMLEKVVEKATELGLYGEWVQAAQDQLARFLPGGSPQALEVELRGSEPAVPGEMLRRMDEAPTETDTTQEVQP